MEDVLDDWLHPNNTDESDCFVSEHTACAIIQDTTAIAFTIVGLVSDIIIIYMIARNVSMRSKANILLMNFAICDTVYLVCNIHFVAPVLALFSYNLPCKFHVNCVIEYLDIGFQLSESIFLILLVSNTIITCKRIHIKWLLIGVYTITALNFVINKITCQYGIGTFLITLGAAVTMLTFTIVLFKELNCCYEKCYKKDPLSWRTRFRLNIGRIYVACWLSTSALYLTEDVVFWNRAWSYIIAGHSYMSSFYILLYIIHADKNFKICFLNLVHYNGAGDYDVDDTIKFAEESSEDSPGNDKINSNFNAMDK